MLGKLMKHEFRATARRMLPLFLVVVLLSCFLRISTAVIDHSTRSLPTILHMLNALLWVLFVLLLIGCVVFAVVVMVNRFYKNLLTDEGYLMFTLPVSIHKLPCTDVCLTAGRLSGLLRANRRRPQLCQS